LVIPALGGWPGVLSARVGGSDEERIERVLRRLGGSSDRRAKFVSAVGLISPSGDIFIFKGEVEGVLLGERRGEGGFGYDPIFWLPELERTMAELLPEEKNRLSHRGRAAAAIRPVLKALAAGQGASER